ncbi:MAG: ATP-dependent DNA helicase RecG [Fuerstiella sp.]|nr:ATP-dependent DNA helicase RecG [Fuerstiella sp.]MCP4853808.1 ATP-dependent DNA helicase RecG [Fuerstiella sp.]
MSDSSDIRRDTTLDDPLQTPVQFVAGVGPQRAALLAKLGIRTALDLLLHLPHSVNDFTDMRPANRLEKDVEQSVHGRVVDRDIRNLSKGRTLVGILLDCEGHFVRGTWFNQPWMLKKFRDDDHVVFSGKPKRASGRWEFSNPRIHWLSTEDEAADIENAVGVLPRYPLTEGIKMDDMRRMTRSVVDGFADTVPDPLPEYYRTHHKLPHLPTALHWLHTPDSKQQFETARHRVILDDLFEFQLGLALRRRVWGTNSKAYPIVVTAKIDARIRRLFEFRFTGGQDQTVKELVADLAKDQPMHRLLQADVGAGKTAIAVYAMLSAVAAGYQAVLMAPTEVLATQHWQTFEHLLRQSRVKRGFLVGGLPAAERRQLLADIATGDCQIVVGTQAVIQESVRFRHLALAVIDEQHRFGVRQRAAFGSVDDAGTTAEDESDIDANSKPTAERVIAAEPDSGRIIAPQRQPHVLVMTATPIPRSLCLTRFGDLDISTIHELPPGRQNVVTSRVQTTNQQERAWEFVRQQIAKGRQTYVVCPRVEGQSDDDDAAAETVFQNLRQAQLKGMTVDLLHGRMDRDTRRDVMDRFRNHEVDVLVSTTVIEVGVDVPNATIMVVQQAERFGLAQLHQLRGRICRGSFQGYCFLISDADTQEANERLKAMEESSDGFKLAETDAQLRGPGDVLGTRQSGALPLRVANPIRDIQILQVARRMAHDLVRTGDFDSPEYQALKNIVLERFAHVLDLPQTG